MSEKPTSPRQIQSVSRTVAILRAISDCGGVGVTELAEMLDIPKSTIHHHLVTLTKEGLLVQEDQTYEISLRSIALFGQVRDTHDAFTKHKHHVDEISARSNMTAQLVIEENGEGIYLYQSTAEGYANDTHLGTCVGLHSSAAGKAILAQFTDDEIKDTLDQSELTQFTENTITDPDAIMEEIEEVREQSVAFDDEEQFEGVRCVAGPIGRDDQYTASISITASRDRMNKSRFKNEMASLVRFLDKRAVFEKEGM